MKRPRRPELVLRIVAAAVCLTCMLISCATAAMQGNATRFSLSRATETTTETGLLMGTVNYGAGFYFPTSTDILDISLLRTDATTGLVTEVSHQRIRNILNFPVQFTVRYDKADIGPSDSCTLIVSLYVDDAIKGQGMTLVQRSGDGFADALLTVYTI